VYITSKYASTTLNTSETFLRGPHKLGSQLYNTIYTFGLLKIYIVIIDGNNNIVCVCCWSREIIFSFRLIFESINHHHNVIFLYLARVQLQRFFYSTRRGYDPRLTRRHVDDRQKQTCLCFPRRVTFFTIPAISTNVILFILVYMYNNIVIWINCVYCIKDNSYTLLLV